MAAPALSTGRAWPVEDAFSVFAAPWYWGGIKVLFLRIISSPMLNAPFAGRFPLVC